eukprot:gnl/Trimastix_PCT/1017.p1 GENE.gnl/Trimastix_PCT/1017~~gnl/Trimastix_PCT/1017.p1  ORF type:complete len:1177 (-),score=415.03 gnl/Trimastix_PCT/1017:129-3659(-)
MNSLFAYLSKKVSIPNHVRLHSVSWNGEQGWIACGGDNGFLKVIKLEDTGLKMNQTVPGHKGSVNHLAWNENYRKLASSDDKGLIYVWIYYQGRWFEEMINNRGKSSVANLKWTSDGQKICIAYKDGSVIVGSHDGKRIWAKDLQDRMRTLCWAPDAKLILFVTEAGEVHVHTSHGATQRRLPLPAIDDVPGTPAIALDWYDGAEGWVDPMAPSLAIAFDNGRVQLMRSDTDEDMIFLDTGMRCIDVHWNSSGTILAIAGYQQPSGANSVNNRIQFYSPYGQHLHTLRLPSTTPHPTAHPFSMSWEGAGQRIAIAMDSCIYFAAVKKEHKWGYFDGTVVYVFTRADQSRQYAVFWDTARDHHVMKQVQNVQMLVSGGLNCCFVTRVEDGSDQSLLILCNALGSPVDTKYIDFIPKYAVMSPTHVVVASASVVFVWNYRTSVPNPDSAVLPSMWKQSRESIFHIDENSFPEDRESSKDIQLGPTQNAICALAVSDTVLVIGRENGLAHRYALPRVALQNRYDMQCRPQKLYLNNESTHLAIIDVDGVLSLYDMDAPAEVSAPPSSVAAPSEGATGLRLDFERKDCWDLKWSDDYPNIFAVMEKARMYIIRGTDPEEPLNSSGNICSFRDLEVRSIMLEELLKDPEQPDTRVLRNFETKSLRDTKEMVHSVDIQEAYSFIEDNPHPRLWRMLAESALEQLNMPLADKAFVLCRDYHGVQFVKRLRRLQDPEKQRAEVAVYFKRFDDAERLYQDMDRIDLAIQLRIKLGDWFRVMQMLKTSRGDDELYARAHNEIGEYFADRQKWSKAIQYFREAENYARLAQCYYVLEDYDALEQLMHQVPQDRELLKRIGHMFASIGLPALSVQAFVQADDVQAAIDACVHLNQWDHAVSLAERFHVSHIDALLSKYATHLLEKKNIAQAIELYTRANKHIEAARLLADLARKIGNEQGHPLRAKKLYVLAGLEVERFRRRTLGAQMSPDFQASMALEHLMRDDAATRDQRELDTVWRGAEAWHFLMMAQRQLYQGQIDAAMKTSLRLAEYCDLLDPQVVHSLIALCAYQNRHFHRCSNAFIKLESIHAGSAAKREAYEELALQIFTRHPPHDPPDASLYDCPSCRTQIPDWVTSCPECHASLTACIASGRSLLTTRAWMCRVCKHRAYDYEMRAYTCCPLCHSHLT